MIDFISTKQGEGYFTVNGKRVKVRRGGKPKDEDFRPAALAAYQGKRARKGRKVEGFPKPVRVVAL